LAQSGVVAPDFSIWHSWINFYYFVFTIKYKGLFDSNWHRGECEIHIVSDR
jgi:hypothetical protein